MDKEVQAETNEPDRKRPRGRDQFARFRRLIAVVVVLFRCMPNWLRDWAWFFSPLLGNAMGAGIRYSIAKTRLGSLGENVYLAPSIVLLHPDRIRLGDNVTIHNWCFLDGEGGIEIGNDVGIAHSSSILTANHTWEDVTLPIYDNPIVPESVRISDDVWIACGARVLSGVTVGKRCVVAAGAVVNRDVPAASLVGGVPAKVIKSLLPAGEPEPAPDEGSRGPAGPVSEDSN